MKKCYPQLGEELLNVSDVEPGVEVEADVVCSQLDEYFEKAVEKILLRIRMW